jgi:hypothetical protein
LHVLPINKTTNKISIAEPHRKSLNATNGINDKTHTDLVPTDNTDVKRTEMVAPNATTRFKTTQKLQNTLITAKYLKKTFKV